MKQKTQSKRITKTETVTDSALSHHKLKCLIRPSKNYRT